jgi:hypothetical protein
MNKFFLFSCFLIFSFACNNEGSTTDATADSMDATKMVAKTTVPVDTAPVKFTRPNLILENTFDEANPWVGFTLANKQYVPVSASDDRPQNITVANAPDGKGKALKYVLNYNDPVISGSVRAEIQPAGSDNPEESERWYGLKYWLEKFDTDDGRESILQWHDVDGTTPPLSIQAGSGSFTIMQSFSENGQNVNYPTELKTYETGKWISFVIHVKWTTAKTGVLQVWRDGKLVVDKHNVQTNSKGGSYMKVGINKWSWAPGGGTSTSTQRIFYIDNVRIGDERATYKDVAP